MYVVRRLTATCFTFFTKFTLQNKFFLMIIKQIFSEKLEKVRVHFFGGKMNEYDTIWPNFMLLRFESHVYGCISDLNRLLDYC